MNSVVDISGSKVKLLTRSIDHRLEFQIEFTPHSGTRKIFEWSRDLDQLFSSLMSHANSINLLTSLPSSLRKDHYRFFGISHPRFQSGISELPAQPVPNQPQISGVLACADGMNPSSDELKAYMGLHPVKDAKLEWLILEMMSDTLPPDYTQHVSKFSVYWTSGQPAQSTWRHPHYAKYSQYIKLARNCILDSPLDRISFQLSNRPNDSNVCSLIELARIYGVKLQTEPYLVHVLSEHDPPQTAISRITAARLNFQTVSQLYRSMHQPVCSECVQSVPSDYCFNCADYFCALCFPIIHDSGMRQTHQHLPTASPPCSECASIPSVVNCTDCADPFCFPCFKRIHGHGGRQNHTPVILVDMKTVNSSEYGVKIEAKYRQMTSFWIPFNGLYYNAEKNFDPSTSPPICPNKSSYNLVFLSPLLFLPRCMVAWSTRAAQAAR